MDRTKNRPLPAGRMKPIEAYLIAGFTGVIGIFILGVVFNPVSGLLGALALISYAFIYTPFKRLVRLPFLSVQFLVLCLY